MLMLITLKKCWLHVARNFMINIVGLDPGQMHP